MKIFKKVNILCCSVMLTMLLSSNVFADSHLQKPRLYIFDLEGTQNIEKSKEANYIKNNDNSLTWTLFGFNIGKNYELSKAGGNQYNDKYLFRSNASIKRIVPVEDFSDNDAVSKSSVVVKNSDIKNTDIKKNDTFETILGVNDSGKSEIAGSDSVSVSADDLKLLEDIVMAESGAEPYEGQVAVTNVIMNRVRSNRYPNTYREVIFQPYQFSPAKNGIIKGRPANDSVKRAVREALGGKRIVPNNTLYFVNPVLATDQTVPNSQTIVKIIKNHTFYQ